MGGRVVGFCPKLNMSLLHFKRRHCAITKPSSLLKRTNNSKITSVLKCEILLSYIKENNKKREPSPDSIARHNWCCLYHRQIYVCDLTLKVSLRAWLHLDKTLGKHVHVSGIFIKIRSYCRNMPLKNTKKDIDKLLVS